MLVLSCQYLVVFRAWYSKIMQVVSACTYFQIQAYMNLQVHLWLEGCFKRWYGEANLIFKIRTCLDLRGVKECQCALVPGSASLGGPIQGQVEKPVGPYRICQVVRGEKILCSDNHSYVWSFVEHAPILMPAAPLVPNYLWSVAQGFPFPLLDSSLFTPVPREDS